jgi:hypothetical protein
MSKINKKKDQNKIKLLGDQETKKKIKFIGYKYISK